MCGRYILSGPQTALDRLFAVTSAPLPAEVAAPRYNIAPGQPVLAVRATAGGLEPWAPRWGLVPSWVKQPGSARTINARVETAASRPAFREPFRLRRCLLPADGFYEWEGAGRARQAWLFRLHDGRPFALAGLWEPPAAQETGTIGTVTILTARSNARVAPVHDRMPVLLAPEAFAAWLDPETEDPAGLLAGGAADELTGMTVGPYVNRVDHEGPRCIEPEAPPPRLF